MSSPEKFLASGINVIMSFGFICPFHGKIASLVVEQKRAVKVCLLVEASTSSQW